MFFQLHFLHFLLVALAIVQANMFPSFVLHWVTNICQDDHPFIIGLNTLGVARVKKIVQTN
jgi:hypothetical protein